MKNQYKRLYENEKCIIGVNLPFGSCPAYKHLRVKLKNVMDRIKESKWLPASFVLKSGDKDLFSAENPFYNGDYRGEVEIFVKYHNFYVPDDFFSKKHFYNQKEVIIYDDKEDNFKIIIKKSVLCRDDFRGDVDFILNNLHCGSPDFYSDRFHSLWKKYVCNYQPIPEKLIKGVDYILDANYDSPLVFDINV